MAGRQVWDDVHVRAESRRTKVLAGLIVLGAFGALCWETDRRAEIGRGDPAPGIPVSVAEGDNQRPPLRGSQGAPGVGESAAPGDAAPLPAAEADRPTHELAVTVRDVDGRPVEGAHVRVSESISPETRRFGEFDVETAGDLFGEDEDDPVAPRPDANARTDAGGVARLDVAVATDHRVRAESDAGVHEVRVKTPSGPGTTEVLIELRPGFRLSGIARRPGGRPVAAARVWVAAPVPGAHPRHLAQLTADAKGRFSFPVLALPATRILIVYVMGANEPGTRIEIPSRTGRIEDVVVILPAATVIRGRCVTEEGKPLAGVRVRGFLPATGEITFTNTQGWFAMKVPGDGGGLLFWVAGRVQTLLRDLHGPPEGVNIGDVVIPKGRVIAGKVLTADGKAAAGAELHIRDPSTLHSSHHQAVGRAGEFRSDVIGPGAHTILVRRALVPGDGRVSCWYVYKPWFAGSTGINLTLPDGVWARISLIDDSSGEAAPFRKGVVHGVPSGQTPIVIYRTFNEAEARTSLDVQFPAPGDYELRVHWVDRTLAAERTVRVTAAKDQTFEFRAR